MAEAAFGVTYDGPALADGRMAVRDLAPALLALGDVFAEASLALYPDREPVALNIKATAEGSFDVLLILEAGGLWDQVTDLLTSQESNAVLAIMAYVGTAIGLIKWMNRRNIEIEQSVEPGKVRVEIGGDAMEVPTEALQLSKNLRVRQHVRKVVEPLERDGVELLEMHSEARVLDVSIGQDDLPAFELEGGDEDLGTREGEAVLAIVAPTFVEGNKWRLSQGDVTFWAPIEDEAFLARVESGEAFRKGDFLECRLRVEQTIRDGDLNTERYVTKVIRHIERSPQEPLGELPPATPEG